MPLPNGVCVCFHGWLHACSSTECLAAEGLGTALLYFQAALWGLCFCCTVLIKNSPRFKGKTESFTCQIIISLKLKGIWFQSTNHRYPRFFWASQFSAVGVCHKFNLFPLLPRDLYCTSWTNSAFVIYIQFPVHYFSVILNSKESSKVNLY